MSDAEFRAEMAARAASYSRSVAMDRANRRDMWMLSLASAGMVWLLLIAIMNGGIL